MQGYILHTQRARDEDLIISVLTENQVFDLYRFYGARHSIIHIGNKIDFDAEWESGFSLPRLRRAMHLGYEWMHDSAKLDVWQRFLQLFHPHLRGVEAIDSYYFGLLESAASKIGKQNAKRVVVESYVCLLEFEGRLHDPTFCFFCESGIAHDEPVSFGRAFLPAHQRCIMGHPHPKESVCSLFQDKSSLYLEDEEVDVLWKRMLEGI